MKLSVRGTAMVSARERERQEAFYTQKNVYTKTRPDMELRYRLMVPPLPPVRGGAPGDEMLRSARRGSVRFGSAACGARNAGLAWRGSLVADARPRTSQRERETVAACARTPTAPNGNHCVFIVATKEFTFDQYIYKY